MNTPARDPSISSLLTGILLFESVVLTATTVAFWHPSPPIRDNWVWLLWFAVPIVALRGFVAAESWYADFQTYRANQGTLRTWLVTRLRHMPPLMPLFAAFIVLTLWNYTAAPYHRASYIVLVCRPLLGMWLVIHCIEHV